MPRELKTRRPSRRRRWFVRLSLLVVGLALLAAAYGLTRLDSWSQRLIEGRLAQALGLDIQIGQIHVSPFRLQVDVTDLTVSGPTDGPGRLLFRLRGGRARLHWSGLPTLTSRRLHLAELVLREPRIETNAEFLEAHRGGGRARRFFLRIERLEVHDGSWSHEDRETRLDLTIRGLEVSGATAGTRFATGRARLELAVSKPPLDEALTLEIDSHFRWRDARVELMGLAARGNGIDVELDGSVSWRDGIQVRADGRASADADQLGDLLSADFPPIGGQVSGPIEVSLGPEPLRVAGELVARRGKFGKLQAEDVRARATYVPGALQLDDLVARAFGGTVSGDVDVDLHDPTAFEVDLEGSGIVTSALMAWLGLPLPIDARADGAFRMSGTADERASWTGEGSFRAKPEADGEGIPAAAQGDFRIADDRLTLRAAPVRAAAASLRVAVDQALEPGGNGTLRLEGTTDNAAATHAATLRILAAIDVELPEILHNPIRGDGWLSATIELGEAPSVALAARLSHGGWGPQAFDLLDMAVEHRGETLTLEHVETTVGPSRLTGSLKLDTREMRILQASVRSQHVEIEPLLALFDVPAQLSGSYSGTLALRHGERGLVGGGRAVLEDGSLFGQRFDRAVGELSVNGEEYGVRGLQLTGSGIDLDGALNWNPYSGDLDVNVRQGLLQLAEVDALDDSGASPEGVIEVTGDVTIRQGDVGGKLAVQGMDVAIRGLPVGGLGGEVELSGEGCRARIDGDAGAGWALDVAVGWTPDLPVDGVLQLDRLVLDLLADHDPPVWADVSGELDFRGPLSRPAEIDLRGTLGTVDLSLGARKLHLDEALDVALAGGVLAVGPVRMLGNETSIEAGLRVNLETQALDATLDGQLNLALISAMVPDLRGTGQVELALAAGGTLAEPEYSGSVKLDRGRLRWLAFGETLEQLTVAASLQDSRVTVDELRGVVGGGEIAGSGELEIGARGLERAELKLDADNVAVSWPEDFNGLYDGELTLIAEPEQVLVRGHIEMLRGLYTKDIDVARLLGFGTREYSSENLEDLGERVVFDVDMFADDNLWLRNDLVEVESRFDLHIGGTLEHPEVTGRLWMLEGGKIEFRDVEYEIASGSLDFVDLQRINPYLVLHAETTVGIYEIKLRIEGTMDQFEYELTSTPSLSQQDIIVLLTTGQTLQELTAQGGGTQFTGDLAANYFAGALTDRFAKQLERLLRLERVQINPLLTPGDADPTTRVTLGKEVANDVLVIVSTDLGSNNRQLYQVEWRATRKLRFTVQDETTTGIGGDLRYSDRLWIKRPPKEPATPLPGRPASTRESTSAPPVGHVTVEGLSDELAAKLVKQLPLRPGGEFKRSRMSDGTQRLRRYFVQQGRLQPDVEAQSGPGDDPPGSVDVVYKVDPGPEFDVVLEGVSNKQQRRLRGHLEKLWTESLFIGNMLSDSADVIRDYYRDRGYYAVDVQPTESGDGDRRELRFEIDRGKPVRVGRVSISGTQAVDEERIRRQMLTKPSALFSRRHFNPRVLKDDIAAIRNLYRDQGLLRATVDPPIIRLSADGGSVDVQLHVDEGPRYTISAIEFVDGDLPYAAEQLLAWSGLAAGQTYSRSRVLTAESELRGALDAHGYPDAVVRSRVELGEESVRVQLELEPRGRKRVGEIRFVGNRVTKDRILRRELELKPGDLISRDRILRSQHRLYQLGIFRNVRLEYSPMPGDDPELQRLDVVVEEAPPVGISFGVGYDTEGGGRASFSLTHENVGGRDRVAGFQGQIGGKLERAGFFAKEPRLFGWELPALFDFSWEQRDEVGYTVRRRSTAFRIDTKLAPLWQAFARYNFQRVDLFDVVDPSAVEQEKLENLILGDIGVSVFRDTRDDPLLPTRGSRISLSTRLFAKPLVSQAEFVKSWFALSFVAGLDNGLSFATSLRLGGAFPFGSTTTVPLSERFFAGGDSTLRGFPRDEVGPKSDLGLPKGGESTLLFNEEFRFPVRGALKGVLFYDAGNVWETASDFDPRDLRHTLGTGLRLETPVGPLRLEYGHKLDREEGESHGELFFAIGLAF